MVVCELDVAGSWADAEDVAKAVLRVVEVDTGSGLRPIGRVGREVAAGRDLDAGTIRIERIGGAPNADETADNPLIELAIFGVDFAQVKAIKRAVWHAWKASVGELVVFDDGTSLCLDGAFVEAGPLRPPWSSEVSTKRSIENWRCSWRPLLDD